jgi:hypothetical protein
VEQEHLTLPDHLGSPQILLGLMNYDYIKDRVNIPLILAI